MRIYKVTPEFLAAAERMARNAIRANADAQVGDGVMHPGKSIVLVEPENQIAMIERIRLLEDMVGDAASALESTSDLEQRRHIARQLRVGLEP